LDLETLWDWAWDSSLTKEFNPSARKKLFPWLIIEPGERAIPELEIVLMADCGSITTAG
jgi:hypothetical protein